MIQMWQIELRNWTLM